MSKYREREMKKKKQVAIVTEQRDRKAKQDRNGIETLSAGRVQ